MKYYKNKKNNYSTITVIAIAGIVLAILAVIVYLNSDYLMSFFFKDNNISTDNANSSVELPFIDDINTKTTEVFYVAPEDIGNMIFTLDTYEREFRVVSSYGDSQSLVRYTMTKAGDKYRVESTDNTIIYDGAKLYIANQVYEHISVTSPLEIFRNIGITPVEDIISKIEQKPYNSTISSNGKNLTIEINDDQKLLRSLYEISLDTGIVINEKHFYNETLFLSVITDNVDVLVFEDIPEDLFKLP